MYDNLNQLNDFIGPDGVLYKAVDRPQHFCEVRDTTCCFYCGGRNPEIGWLFSNFLICGRSCLPENRPDERRVCWIPSAEQPAPNDPNPL